MYTQLLALNFVRYSEMCLNQIYLEPAFVFRIDRVLLMQVKLTNISYIRTLVKIRCLMSLLLKVTLNTIILSHIFGSIYFLNLGYLPCFT